MVERTPLAGTEEQAAPAPEVAPADAFGGQVVGQGLSKLGGTLQKADDVFTQHAEALATLNNRANADASNQKFNEDMGRFTVQWQKDHMGQNSTDPAAMDSFYHGIEDIRQQHRGDLSNPMAQSFYDQDSRRFATFQGTDARRWITGQQNEFRINQNKSVIEQASSDGASNPGDPVRVAHALSQMDGSLKDLGDAVGWSPEELASAKQQAHGDMWMRSVQTMVHTSPKAAYALAHEHWDDMTDRQREQINNGLYEPLMAHVVADHAEGAQFGAGPSGPVSLMGGGATSPNNIGNVKGAGGGFARPATPVDGVVLTANNLRHGYQGLTLSQIAQKWTGGDHPQTWLANVSRASGIAPGAVPNLNDPATLSSLVRGIGVGEKTGSQLAAFTPQVISQGVSGALAGHQPKLGASHGGVDMNSPDAVDQLRTTYGVGLDAAIAGARKEAGQYGLDPVIAQERVEQKYRGDFNQNLYAATQTQDVYMNTVLGAVEAGGKNGQPIRSMADLMANPEAAKAYAGLSSSAKLRVQGALNTEDRQYDDSNRAAELTGMANSANKLPFLALKFPDEGLSRADNKRFQELQAKERVTWQQGGKTYANAESLVMHNPQGVDLITNGLKYATQDRVTGAINPVPGQERNYHIFLGRATEAIEEWQQQNPAAKGKAPPEVVTGIINRVAGVHGIHTPGPIPGLPNLWGSDTTANNAAMSDDLYQRTRSALAQSLGYDPQDWQIGYYTQKGFSRYGTGGAR